MDVRDVFRIVFWAWLLISVAILIRRSLARGGSGDATTAAPTKPATPVSPALPTELPAQLPEQPPEKPPERPERQLETQLAREPTEPPTDPPRASPSVTPVGPQSSIFDANPAPEVTRTIAEMVQGIQLPCELAPLMEYVSRSDASESAVFVTSGHSAAEVGSQVGAELRRLGFELQPVQHTEVIASRPPDSLHVAVHEAAASVEREGQRAFPALPESAVVVEFWTS